MHHGLMLHSSCSCVVHSLHRLCRRCKCINFASDRIINIHSTVFIIIFGPIFFFVFSLLCDSCYQFLNVVVSHWVRYFHLSPFLFHYSPIGMPPTIQMSGLTISIINRLQKCKQPNEGKKTIVWLLWKTILYLQILKSKSIHYTSSIDSNNIKCNHIPLQLPMLAYTAAWYWNL